MDNNSYLLEKGGGFEVRPWNGEIEAADEAAYCGEGTVTLQSTLSRSSVTTMVIPLSFGFSANVAAITSAA
jgi:hypothetical protein